MVEVELSKTEIEIRWMGVQNVNMDIIMGQLEGRRVDWYMVEWWDIWELDYIVIEIVWSEV